MCVRVSVCACVCVRTCVRACGGVCVCVCVFECVYACVLCAYVGVCLCVGRRPCKFPGHPDQLNFVIFFGPRTGCTSLLASKRMH